MNFVDYYSFIISPKEFLFNPLMGNLEVISVCIERVNILLYIFGKLFVGFNYGILDKTFILRYTNSAASPSAMPPVYMSRLDMYGGMEAAQVVAGNPQLYLNMTSSASRDVNVFYLETSLFKSE
jgi:hypothetical protein